MKLIELVKDSLDATGIAYEQPLITLPNNVLIVHPVIKSQQWKCAVRTIDMGGIICVEYFLDYEIDGEDIYNELVEFALLVNNALSLGLLNIDFDNNAVSFKNGVHIDYIELSQLAISKFIQQSGEIAATLKPYINSIVEGSSKALKEFDLLKGKSNDPLLPLQLAKA